MLGFKRKRKVGHFSQKLLPTWQRNTKKKTLQQTESNSIPQDITRQRNGNSQLGYPVPSFNISTAKSGSIWFNAKTNPKPFKTTLSLLRETGS